MLAKKSEQKMEDTRATQLLLIEDDVKLGKLIQEYLESNHFQVSIETRGDAAVARILDEVPDLVILDIMLPGKDGRAICREVRPRYAGPIMMLTALGEETDEVIGLEIGADDYLSKPVSPRLLLTRIQTLLRRMNRGEGVSAFVVGDSGEQPRKLVLGTLEIDAGNRLVKVDGQLVETTTAEFELMYYLALHPGQVLTREQIYRDLRGIDYDGLDRSIDLRIARLRKKLGDDSKQPRRIKSIRGSGYLLAEDQ